MPLVPTLEIEGLYFAEDPRWHENQLWWSDIFGKRVCRSDSGAAVEVTAFADDKPSGLGWLPDGRLLVVGMERQALYCVEPSGRRTVHADLSGLARGMTNDMVVGPDGTAYVGDMGLPVFGQQAERKPGQLLMVTPDGRASQAADDLAVPNGMVITPDQRTLIVVESWAARLTAFDIGPAGSLSGRRTFADLPPHGDGDAVHPDGMCLDAEGAVWFADLTYREVVRVLEGGEITHSISLDPLIPIACALGGVDRRTLFVCANEHLDVSRLGQHPTSQILSFEVATPGAGWP